MDEKRIDDQIPEEAAPKTEDTSFVKKAGKWMWAAVRSIPGEFLNFWRSYPPKARKIAAIVAVVVLIAVAAFEIGGKIAPPNFKECSFYFKDNQLYLCTADGYTRKITENLFSGKYSGDYVQWEYSTFFDQSICLSGDGKTLYYMDNITLKEAMVTEATPVIDTCELYRMDLTNEWKPPEKIAENARPCKTNHNGSLLTYWTLNGKEYMLYQYNLFGSVPVVKFWYGEQFRTSEDGNTLLYMERETKEPDTATLYRKTGVGLPEKIDEGVKSIAGYNRDMSTVVYKKNGDIYMKVGQKATKMIAQNGLYISGVFEDNSLYYRTRDQEPRKATEFVVDDLQNDSSKQIMDTLAEKEIYLGTYTLWYYDGEKSVKVSDLPAKYVDQNLEGLVDCAFLEYAPELPQLKLSELLAHCEEFSSFTPEGEVAKMVGKLWEAAGKYCVCMDGKKSVIPLEGVKRIEINETGTVVYLWVGKDDSKLYDLYRMEISDGNVGEPELVTENFLQKYAQMANYEYDETVGFISNDAYVYWVVTGDKSSDLYMNGNKVDSNISPNRGLGYGGGPYIHYVQHCEKTGLLYYLKNTEDGKAMMEYDGKTSKEIASQVTEFIFTPEGDVLMRRETEEKDVYDLWRWNGTDLVKVDENVGHLILPEEYYR